MLLIKQKKLSAVGMKTAGLASQHANKRMERQTHKNKNN